MALILCRGSAVGRRQRGEGDRQLKKKKYIEMELKEVAGEGQKQGSVIVEISVGRRC